MAHRSYDMAFKLMAIAAMEGRSKQAAEPGESSQLVRHVTHYLAI